MVSSSDDSGVFFSTPNCVPFPGNPVASDNNTTFTLDPVENLSYDTTYKIKVTGGAEADPASDVEGFDAARKISILASIAFNSRVTSADVYVEGITRITPEDIRYARELRYVIKLLAIARETPAGIEVRVHPAMISETHPLAAVKDVYNAVFVRGNAVGEAMFYGRGAGELPTASAVVGFCFSEPDLVRDRHFGA